MAVLNSYIENGKYDLIGEVHDFNNESKKFVHESRLLNPKVFSLSESPMFEDGVVDVGALAMAMKAYPFLNSFSNHIRGMVNYQIKKLKGNDLFWNLDGLKITDETEQNISGICSEVHKFSSEFAIITEYLTRHYPEDAKIIEKDWSRYNPYNFLQVLEENGKDIGDYGFELIDDEEFGPEIHFLPPHDVFNAKDIDITEKQFLDRVAKMNDLAPKFNFAIDLACSFLNLFNYRFFKFELNEFETDPEVAQTFLEEIKQPVKSTGGTPLVTRWFEATFRKRKYDYSHKLPDIPQHYGVNYNDTLTPYRNFLTEECKPLSADLRNALKTLNKHGTSLRYKGKQLEKLKECASVYEKFLESRDVVFGWYHNRFNWIEDNQMESAMEYILENYETIQGLIDVRQKLNLGLFIADQQIVNDYKAKGEELPVVSQIKTEMDAIEKLGPHLDKLGLKIVPKDYQDARENLTKLGKNISDSLLSASTKMKLANINLSPDWQNIRNHLAQSKDISNIKIPKIPSDVWLPDTVLAAHSKVTVAAVKVSKDEKGTESFEEGFEYKQKQNKWIGTAAYSTVYDKLGKSLECTVLKVGEVYLGKRILTPDEQADLETLRQEEKKKPKDERVTIKHGDGVSRRYASERGAAFLKDNDVKPYKNFRNLTRAEAAIRVFQSAFRTQSKDTKITSEMSAATKLLKDDKKLETDTDKVLRKHLKKLKLGKEEVDSYIKDLDKLEGKREGTSGSKYLTEEVAIAICEDHERKKNSSQ